MTSLFEYEGDPWWTYLYCDKNLLIQMELSHAFSIFWTVIIPTGGIIGLLIATISGCNESLPFTYHKQEPYYQYYPHIL